MVVKLAGHERKDDEWQVVTEAIHFFTKVKEEVDAGEITYSLLMRYFSLHHNRTELWTKAFKSVK